MILESESKSQFSHQLFNAWLNGLWPQDNDPFGRRIEYKVIAGNQTTISKYLYDNEDIAFIIDGSNVITHAFVHGPGIDEPIAFTDVNNTPYFYMYDGLGSVVGLTNNSEHVAESYDYDSFGRYLGQGSNAIKQPYTFTGREFDQESELYYYRARYYDPQIGRFISRDAFGGFPDIPSTLHRYTYVRNNPINDIDPSGNIDISAAERLQASLPDTLNRIADVFELYGVGVKTPYAPEQIGFTVQYIGLSFGIPIDPGLVAVGVKATGVFSSLLSKTLHTIAKNLR